MKNLNPLLKKDYVEKLFEENKVIQEFINDKLKEVHEACSEICCASGNIDQM